MAKATINTGLAAQPVHTRTTGDAAESQVFVIGIDGSDSVVPADPTKGVRMEPSTAGDVASTLTDGRKTVTTPGTAVALRASLVCKWVLATALKTNTDQVNVGGAGVLAASGSSTGQPLAAGESVSIPVSNASLVFVDARVAGEGVSFTVGS